MSELDKKTDKRSNKSIFFARLQLLLLFAVFLSPIAGAYYFYSKRDQLSFATVNNGDLYQSPQDLIDLPISLDGAEEITFNQMEKKWYLLVVADGECGKVCEENLLKVRQLRRMQGKNVNRVVSGVVHRGLQVSVANDLAAKYSIAQIAVLDSSRFDQWLKPFYEARGEQSFDASRIYVVDPLKKLMMSYPADVEPKLFYKDLKRLLKVSQVG